MVAQISSCIRYLYFLITILLKLVKLSETDKSLVKEAGTCFLLDIFPIIFLILFKDKCQIFNFFLDMPCDLYNL